MKNDKDIDQKLSDDFDKNMPLLNIKAVQLAIKGVLNKEDVQPEFEKISKDNSFVENIYFVNRFAKACGEKACELVRQSSVYEAALALKQSTCFLEKQDSNPAFTAFEMRLKKQNPELFLDNEFKPEIEKILNPIFKYNSEVSRREQQEYRRGHEILLKRLNK